jgi:hypothetical protein
MNCAIQRITRRSTSEAAGEKCHLAQSWFTADANSSPRTAAWFPPVLIYPRKRGARYNVEFAKMLFSTSCRMASIGCGFSGRGSSNSAAISNRLLAGVTRARSSPRYNRTTSSDALHKSARNVSRSESRLVPCPEVCPIISLPAPLLGKRSLKDEIAEIPRMKLRYIAFTNVSHE